VDGIDPASQSQVVVEYRSRARTAAWAVLPSAVRRCQGREPAPLDQAAHRAAWHNRALPAADLGAFVASPVRAPALPTSELDLADGVSSFAAQLGVVEAELDPRLALDRPQRRERTDRDRRRPGVTMSCARASITWIALVALVACRPEPAKGPDSMEEPEREAPTNRVEIPATVRRNLGITFAAVELRQVERTVRVPGSFELEPRARREYHMALAGQVELLVDQYAPVEPGQPLFRFRSPAWRDLVRAVLVADEEAGAAGAASQISEAKLAEARAKLAVARARLEALARADFKRVDLEIDALALEGTLPVLEAELSSAGVRLASAARGRQHALAGAAAVAGLTVTELEAATPSGDGRTPRYLSIEWIDVLATAPGFVEALHVSDGAYVEAAAAVLRVVDPTRLRFRATALQADLVRLMGAVDARIVAPEAPGTPPTAGVRATVSTGFEADPEARTVSLVATPVELAPWIRPGIAAFLEVVVASSDAPALAVPRSSIVQDGLVHVLFRRDPADPNKAIRIEADMGVSDGRWVVLESGVARGDEVVLAGAYELKLATQQDGKSQAGGHFHADGTFHSEN
jgi:multidrug resistance efflux pump